MKRIKRVAKKVLILMLVLTLFKVLFIGGKKTYTTPVGEYTCIGGVFKVCNGSNEVADYLGVK